MSRRGPAGANSERLLLPARPVLPCVVFHSQTLRVTNVGWVTYPLASQAILCPATPAPM